MDLQLNGDSVLIFGAARGIGRSVAERFHAEGAAVVGVDISWPDDQSYPFECHTADATKRDDVTKLAQLHGDVDHIVYAVGVGSGQAAFPFWKQHVDVWRRVIDINLMGAVEVAHAFAPKMADRRRGSFLFFVSVAAQIGSPTDPPYSAAKAGLLNFMQVVARDMAEFEVRSNALSPGMVRTDLNKSVWAANQQGLSSEKQQSYDDWTAEKIRNISPLGRWQSAEECAAVAAFLASPHAQNITGQTLNVDGGQVMHS